MQADKPFNDVCLGHQLKWHDKVWGETAEVFYAPHCAVHYLRIEAGEHGTFCSRHYHKHRANRFVVISGEIDVVIYREREERHRIKPGEAFDVPSQVVHRFEVVKSGVMIEIYWPDSGFIVIRDDIERLEEGGEFDLHSQE